MIYPGNQDFDVYTTLRSMARSRQTYWDMRKEDLTFEQEENTMNRKLFRRMTLVVTVLLALAITAPALADPLRTQVLIWEEDFQIENPCGKKIEDDIWLTINHNWQVRYEYDENGGLVEVISHTLDRWHVYNKLHPELFIDGMTEGTGHFNERKGVWVTGVNFNFHAPGYPQIGHFSGYWTFDEGGNIVLVHGLLEDINIPVFCGLLTPP